MHMKRILLIIALAILPMVCHAQLNVTRKVEKMEKLSSARLGLVSLNRQGDLFYIGLPTTNQYDDPFILYLGDGQESAMKTLEDLIGLHSTIEKGSPIVIKNGKHECTISKGVGTLNLNQEGFAGYGELAKTELQKFLKVVKSLK